MKHITVNSYLPTHCLHRVSKRGCGKYIYNETIKWFSKLQKKIQIARAAAKVDNESELRNFKMVGGKGKKKKAPLRMY